MLRSLVALVVVAAVPLSALAQEKANYYPLGKGTKWEYQVSAGGREVVGTSEITTSETKDGKTVSKLEVTFPGQTAIGEDLSSDAKGVYRNAVLGVKLTTPVTVLKYPVKAGDEWTDKTKVGDMEMTVTSKVKALDDAVTVGAGKYKAVKVEVAIKAPGVETTVTTWYADGVGVVKQSMELMGQTITLELKKFTPAK